MLKDHQDAFGHQLYDYFILEKGVREIPGIIERRDGYIDDSGSMATYFSEYKDWIPLEKKAIRYAKGRILDVGPGAGRHSIYLQEKRHEVTGIDNSPLAIEVCRMRGLKDARVMSLNQIHSGLGTFDTVLMMGNNFGLFESYNRTRRLLKRFSKMTTRHARIITTTNNIYMSDKPEHLSYQEYNRKHGRMGGQIRIRVRYKKYATPWFDYLMVSKEEMKNIMEGTDWMITKYIDSGDSHYAAILEKRKIGANK